jgi:hypothetical protein
MWPAVRWIPAVLFASAVACNGTFMVGSKFIKTQAIRASQGGTIIVSSTDDPNLTGLTIQIPAGALATDTTITIAEAPALSASQLGETTQDGTTVEFGPIATRFQIAATVTLPFAADGGSDVSVIGVEDDGSVLTFDSSELSIDAQANRVTFSVPGFTRYAVVVPRQIGTECAQGYLVCDAGGAVSCVNPLVDPSNCHRCGNVCPGADSCVNGSCECDLTICTSDAGAVCSDTETDPLNCGGCDAACPPNEVCISGKCACLPSSTIAECAASDGGLSCVDLLTDSSNCNGCGIQCPSDQHCAAPEGVSGVCVCDEPDGGPPIIESCDDTCVDTTQDPHNCGGCGNVCVSGSCVLGDAGAGVCACPLPYRQCGPSCVDTYGDVNHCGSCDNDCYIVGKGLTDLNCNLGKCYCSGDGTICSDGGCALVESDPLNCGACGFVCEVPSQDCVSGVCTCPFSQSLCGQPDAGIPLSCIDTAEDGDNCGVCGNVCIDTYAAGSICSFGLCSCPPAADFLCGAAGSGRCIPADGGACDAGTEPSTDGG